MSDLNPRKKKFPYFIGVGMIAAGIVSMILSGQLDESARSPLIFVGVLVFVGGFAATVIYSTKKQSELEEEEGKKKKPKSRAEITMWIFGIVCIVGLLALLAGFVLFGSVNMPVVLIGMVLFLVGGSTMLSIFQKHSSEFLKKDENEDSDKK